MATLKLSRGNVQESWLQSAALWRTSAYKAYRNMQRFPGADVFVEDYARYVRLARRALTWGRDERVVSGLLAAMQDALSTATFQAKYDSWRTYMDAAAVRDAQEGWRAL